MVHKLQDAHAAQGKTESKRRRAKRNETTQNGIDLRPSGSKVQGLPHSTNYDPLSWTARRHLALILWMMNTQDFSQMCSEAIRRAPCHESGTRTRVVVHVGQRWA